MTNPLLFPADMYSVILPHAKVLSLCRFEIVLGVRKSASRLRQYGTFLTFCRFFFRLAGRKKNLQRVRNPWFAYDTALVQAADRVAGS